jgi:ribonuclease BN (tRNA processing enzyme)
MRVDTLGCSGGIGGLARTTALRVDSDILIDCGTGVGDLALEDLMQIDHVFLTHSHLDHIALLPLLIDTVCEIRGRPLTVYAQEETLRTLRAHVFNWLVWPDFTAIPDRLHPMLMMHPIRSGETLQLGTRRLHVLPAQHTVPTVGYCVESERGEQLAFTGDTSVCDSLIDALNGFTRLRYLLIETAFPNEHQNLAHAAHHLAPVLLHAFLGRLRGAPQVMITHFKPGYAERTAQEVLNYTGSLQIGILSNGQSFDL